MNISTFLFSIFLILKLCNVIDWSWWWVCSPLWIGLILSLILRVIWEYFKRKSRAAIFDRLNDLKKQQEKLLKERNK